MSSTLLAPARHLPHTLLDRLGSLAASFCARAERMQHRRMGSWQTTPERLCDLALQIEAFEMKRASGSAA